MTEFGNIHQFAEFLKEHRKNKILPYNIDYPVLVTGEEGVGKSLLAIFLAHKMDPNFDINNICFRTTEYIKFQLNSKFFYSIKKDMPQWYTGQVKPGSAIVFDEAGTQAYARNFYSPENIELNKVFIGGRALNLIHFLLVPKPGSIDQYLREERTKMFIHTYMTPSWERRCMVFLRGYGTINRIINTPKWQLIFSDHREMRRRFKPDGDFSIPDLRMPEMIPRQLLLQYETKKKRFVFDLLYGAVNKIENNDRVDVILQDILKLDIPVNEQVDEFKKRTEKSFGKSMDRATFFRRRKRITKTF